MTGSDGGAVNGVKTQTLETDDMADAGETGVRRTFHGRRHGRPLNAGRKEALDRELPARGISLPRPGERLDPQGLFSPRRERVWLEIGFGNGEHLLAQARAHRDVGLIGCEPFVSGMAALLKELVEDPLDNIRVFGDDARQLIDALPDASVERVFLLFADPWPKRRHNKRRFIQRATLDQLARILVDGGELRAATDHYDLAGWTVEHTFTHPAFEWTAERAADWRLAPADHIETRYEAKARRQGRQSVYLSFRRIPRVG